LVGSYTRLAAYFSSLDKQYRATIRFGETTETLDPEGEIRGCGRIPARRQIAEAFHRFIGEIEQVPPIYSAVHHKGARAYQLARAGKQPPLASRKVTIHRMDLETYEAPELVLRVHCSKGTYIRSLARDLGIAVGSCAYLTALARTAVGVFRLEDAVKPGERDLPAHLIPAIEFVRKLPGLDIAYSSPGREKDMQNGRPLDDSFFQGSLADGDIAVFDHAHELVAVVSRENGRYRYIGVFHR
jgi:tRNA pseudouridine55 synthase